MSEDATLDEFVEAESDSSEPKAEDLARKTVCGIPPQDWTVARLGELVRVVSGNSLPTEYQNGKEGEYPVYKVSDMNATGNQKYVSDTSNRLSKGDLEEINHTLYPEGATILPKVGAALLTNKRRMLTEASSFDNNVMGWVPDEINPEFLYYVSCMINMEAVAQKGAVPSISKAIAKSLKLPSPPLSEQRKIATVLYTVDRAIEKTDQTIEQMEVVQEGLLRSLFGKESQRQNPDIETKIERLGPKQFQVPVTWKTTEICSIGRIVTGDTPSTDDESNFGGTLPFVTPATLSQGKYVTESNRTLSEAGRAEAKPIPEGSVMMDCIGSDMGKVAVAGCEVATNQQINSVVIEDESYLSEFLYYHLQVLSDFIKSQAGQTATPIVNKSSFESFAIFNPPLEEQQEIVDTVSLYDEGRQSNIEYLAELKRLKQGLMQDLLSGTVRTTDTNIEVPDEIAQYG